MVKLKDLLFLRDLIGFDLDDYQIVFANCLNESTYELDDDISIECKDKIIKLYI